MNVYASTERTTEYFYLNGNEIMYVDTTRPGSDTNTFSIYFKKGDKFYFQATGKDKSTWSAARAIVRPMF